MRCELPAPVTATSTCPLEVYRMPCRSVTHSLYSALRTLTKPGSLEMRTLPPKSQGATVTPEEPALVMTSKLYRLAKSVIEPDIQRTSCSAISAVANPAAAC